MGGAFGRLGDLFGLLGVLACLISGVVRVTGDYYIGGLTATAVFDAGLGLMLFACLLKLHAHGRSHHA